ncbi:MAG: GNAT family N-acetyltransferase [Betaproteobacteria bacterium]
MQGIGIAPLARLEITTARLRLLAGDPGLVGAVCEFQRRNRQHFAPWDPPTADSFYSAEAQSVRVAHGLTSFQNDTAYRYWMIDATRAGGARLPSTDVEVIGSLHFSQVSRGAFQSAMLGYALDEAHVGQGLMTEALVAGLDEMFSPRVNLHRVQAAYRPENVRSARVLERLGFQAEGLAPAYLYIDGAWRDHVVTSLRNPNFALPDGW